VAGLVLLLFADWVALMVLVFPLKLLLEAMKSNYP